MGFWRIVFTIILPPLGVLLGKGFGWAFIINIVLTLLGYILVLFTRFGCKAKTKRATIGRCISRSARPVDQIAV